VYAGLYGPLGPQWDPVRELKPPLRVQSANDVAARILRVRPMRSRAISRGLPRLSGPGAIYRQGGLIGKPTNNQNMKSENTAWNQLLERSAELADRLAPVIRQGLKSQKPRFTIVRDLCGLVMEHAESVRLLMRAENFTSAAAQLRTQYETVLRPVWVRFSAPETSVTKLIGGLTEEDLALRAGNLPMAKEMLDHLAVSPGVPRRILRSLLSFRAELLKESNSAVHSGSHAIYRHRSGYPELSLVQLIQASNDLLIATARLQAALSGSRAQREELALIGMEFAGCLPPSRTAA